VLADPRASEGQCRFQQPCVPELFCPLYAFVELFDRGFRDA
jgi:hypothetical protein